MLKVINEIEVPLMSRKRVTFLAEHTNGKTPSRLEVKEEVAKQMKVSQDLISVRHIYSKYGVGMSKVITHIYQDKVLKDLLEPMKKKEIEALKKMEEEKKKVKEAKVTAEASKDEVPKEK